MNEWRKWEFVVSKRKWSQKMGKNKEAEARHGVAHVKKGRKGKRWLR